MEGYAKHHEKVTALGDGISVEHRSRILAALLGIILGGLGLHKFYLGRIAWGIVYLVFSWTLIPAIVGFIEGVVYLSMSDHRFARLYDRKVNFS